MLSRPELFSITLKGAINPTAHHPSWYYTIGQLSKEDAASIVENENLYVTPALGKFSAPLFSIDCDKKQWRVKTQDKDARLHILYMTLKTFDNLLPEALLKRFGFKFAFSIETSHEKNVDFISKLMQDFVQVKAKGEISTTILSTTSTDPVRQTRVRLHSSPGANRVLLTFNFVYPIPDARIFTLRQLPLADDYELDYEEAITQAEQIAHKLMDRAQMGRADINSN